MQDWPFVHRKEGRLAFDLKASARQTYWTYHAVFDRATDAEGLGFWIKSFDEGSVILIQISQFFIQLEEFEKIYG